MPMIRQSNDNGIKGLVFQYLSEIPGSGYLFLLACLFYSLKALRQGCFFYIADVGHINSFGPGKSTCQSSTPGVGAKHCYRNRVICRYPVHGRYSVASHKSQANGRGGGFFYKIPSVIS